MTTAYPRRAAQFAQRAPAWPARNNMDVTLSTEEGDLSAVPQRRAGHGDYFDEDTMTDDFRQRAKAMSSPIKGRQGRANAYEHISPAIAARHQHLRSQAGLGRSPMRMPLAADDTESDNESSSSASSASIMGATAPFYSVAESTGNHQGLISSPEARTTRRDRPRLDNRALDELDRVSRRGTSARAPRSSTVRPASKPQYRSPFKPVARPADKHRHAVATDGEATSRKVSSGSSSNGKKHPGTAGSTSGDTLVDEDVGKRGGLGNDILLPSGQYMGKSLPFKDLALPEMTGMTSALESPVRERIGVQHKSVNRRQMEEAQVNFAQIRADTLAGIIRTSKLDSGRPRERADLLRQGQEYTTYVTSEEEDQRKRDKPRKHGVRSADAESIGNAEGDSPCDRKFQLISQHVMQLDRDLKAQRQEIRDVLRPTQEYMQSTKRMPAKATFKSNSSPRKTAQHYEDPEPSLEEHDFLKAQVETVLREVDRLKDIVHQRDEAHADKAASSPIKPSNGSKAFGLKGFGRAKPLEGARAKLSAKLAHFESSPGSSEEDESDCEEGQRHAASKRHGTKTKSDIRHSDTEAQLAHKRAESAMRKVPTLDIQHNTATCAKCGRNSRQGDMREAAKQRSFPDLKRRFPSRRADVAFDSTQEEIIFDVLRKYAPGDQGRALASFGILGQARQQSLLHYLLRERKDEFYHFRKSCGEMADELKKMDPSMHPVDRKILADAVIDMVHTLEQCIMDINVLQVALELNNESATGPDDDAFASEPEGRNARQHRHSRKSSHARRRSHNASPVVDGHASSDYH